jgi:hypothetical protein
MRKSGEFEIGILLSKKGIILRPKTRGTTFKIGIGKQIFWPTKCFPNSKNYKNVSLILGIFLIKSGFL